ncbi:hypothetical protein B0A48_12064 [Cryoendolithus antarcticus]|uniref:Anaphase-promoting complex subunit 4 WD40 domain-containing protein n=1 Tax=Cryoendolithus antarcticus TaxID=1507870 RepID=A0A1V8STL3_9PEZI|nr:hypothetical protein B0A48_12064 [Cryoendolithus antarcticus]
MASERFHRFSHGHQDLVTDVSYNIYGTRMATASADHRIKVWDLVEVSSTWTVTDVWVAHDASVTCVKWNGPFVGEHLGSIGEDGTLKIWQEDVSQAINSGRRWRQIFRMVTATGVPYAHLDFKNIGVESYYAAITRDGHLTICEPAEDHDDLSSWKIMWEDYLCKTPSRMEETGYRLSWHREILPAWPAVLAGLDRKSLSLAAAVGTTVKVFRTDKDRKFYIAATLEGTKGLVRDVDWSNGSMRGFDTLATASKDGFIRIYELHTPGAASFATSGSGTQEQKPLLSHADLSVPRPTRSAIGAGLAGGVKGKRDEQATAPGAVRQDVKLVAELELHDALPWRAQWSPEGGMLVTTADDGIVRLWKKSIDGKWLEAAEIDGTKE